MSILRYIVLGGLAFCFLGALSVLWLFWHYSGDLPDIEQMEDYNPPQVSRVYAADGSVIGAFGEERRTLVPVDEIPPLLLNAFVATEDAGFHQHPGVDIWGIARAVIRNVLALKVRQGASTITQQVVKNLILTPERSLKRKVQEAILAYRIEKSLSKREILYLYANAIYFGNGVYGVAEAARYYFGKTLKELDTGEIAYLAGLPKNPEGYRLDRFPDRANKRRNHVLNRLEKLQYIDEETAKRYSEQPLVFERLAADAENARAPYVESELRRRLGELIGKEELDAGGLRISSTIDPLMQRSMAAELRRNLSSYDRRHGYRPLPVISEPDRKKWNALVEKAGSRFSRKGMGEDLFAFSAEHRPFEVNAQSAEEGEPGASLTGETVDSAAFWRTIVRRVKLGRCYYAYVVKVDGASGDLEVELGGRRGRIAAGKALWALKRKTKDALSSRLMEAFKPGQAVVVSLSDKYDPESRKEGPLPLDLSQIPEAQAAMLALDPESRAIRAFQGGFAFHLSPFNRAIQAKRQPGSSFKAFVYLAAVRSRKFTSLTEMIDEKISFPLPGGRIWSPRNYDGRYRGPVRLRQAIAHSINTIAVKVAKDVGLNNIIDCAKSLGVRSELKPNLSLALGSSELTLLEMVNAYATFPTGGIYDDAYLIEKVVSSRGKVLYRHAPRPRRVLSEEEAALMVSLLASVVKEGTSRRALALGHPAAGKTGTTNDQVDAWFVGFTTELACGSWVGYDDRRGLGRGETGARAALPAWVGFMKAVMADKPVKSFPSAPNLVHAWIDPESGRRVEGGVPNAVDEVFLEGTEPPVYEEEPEP